MSEVIKTDDTDAFGGHFGAIKISNPNKIPISKIVVVTNSGTCIPNKTFTDADNFTTEEIVLNIDYSSVETQNLNATNTLNVVTYDIYGKQKTCPQTYTFYAQNGVITRNGRTCC